MTRLLAFLFVLFLAAPALAAPSRLDRLMAEGTALTDRGDASCAVPLEAAAFAAERDDSAYARAPARQRPTRKAKKGATP